MAETDVLISYFSLCFVMSKEAGIHSILNQKAVENMWSHEHEDSFLGPILQEF